MTYVIKFVALFISMIMFNLIKTEDSNGNIFEKLEGPMAEHRDECLQDNSMSIEDLHDYKDVDEIPETELCFYKCFFNKMDLIDNDGNVLADNFKHLPDVKDFTDEVIEKAIDCFKKIDNIEDCEDMKKFETCFQILEG